MANSTKVPNKADRNFFPLNEEKSNPDTVSINTITVKIICLLDAKVKVTGTVTGNLYIWERAGTALDVDIRDKDEILNKRRGGSCCGNNYNSPLFILGE